MPEHINICCLFDKAPPDRRSVFARLFNADPAWMGQPHSIMVLDTKNGRMSEDIWPSPELVVEQTLERKVLFVYSEWSSGTPRFRSSIGLKETSGLAVYTLGFPASLLQQSSIAEVEHRFLRIFDAAASIGNTSILIGSELEATPARLMKEVILSAFDPASLVTWIVAKEQYLPEDVRPFEIITKERGIALLRHADAAKRVGLSTARRLKNRN